MLKTTNLKKTVLIIIVFLIIYFVYEYQKPILTTEEAKGHAVLCLNFPPKEFEIKGVDVNYDDILSMKLSIDKKDGFFNKYTNKRDLSITLKTKNDKQSTVKINAYDGECLSVPDPLN